MQRNTFFPGIPKKCSARVIREQACAKNWLYSESEIDKSRVLSCSLPCLHHFCAKHCIIRPKSSTGHLAKSRKQFPCKDTAAGPQKSVAKHITEQNLRVWWDRYNWAKYSRTNRVITNQVLIWHNRKSTSEFFSAWIYCSSYLKLKSDVQWEKWTWISL